MTLRSIHLAGVATLGGILLLASSSTKPTKGLYESKSVGDYLPKVKITNERTTGDVHQEGGNGLTLIHFWAAYDAESRANQLLYSSVLSKQSAIAYQSVSLDVDADVYKQTLAFDGVGNSPAQLLVGQAERTQLIELCGLNEGLHSYLIDAQGKILKIDPSTEELQQFVRNWYQHFGIMQIGVMHIWALLLFSLSLLTLVCLYLENK